jgi:hypothetical protein
VLLVSTLELDPLGFAGLRTHEVPSFRFVGLHRHLRHPTYLGWFFVLWSGPTMTVGRAFLAAALTAYARYPSCVPAFFPRIRGSRRS